MGRSRAAFAIALVAVLVIVLIASTLGGAATRSESSLSGFWAGSPAFLKGAGLKAMYVYVEPRADGAARAGYVVAVDERGRELTNRSFELTTGAAGRLWRAGCAAGGAPHNHIAEFTFDGDRDEDSEGPAALPARAALAVDAADGSLTVRDKSGNVRCRLLRDNEVSQALRDNEVSQARRDNEVSQARRDVEPLN